MKVKNNTEALSSAVPSTAGLGNTLPRRKIMECVMICGVDCKQGDDNCNGYCIGKAPMAKTYQREEDQEIWLVMDERGFPIYCAGWPDACHEHINDAINEHEIDGAASWKVRRASLVPNA